MSISQAMPECPRMLIDMEMDNAVPRKVGAVRKLSGCGSAIAKKYRDHFYV